MNADMMKTNVSMLKPNIDSLREITEIPLDDTVVTLKLDGEFTACYYFPDVCYTVNKWGTFRRFYPAVDELMETLAEAGIDRSVFRCELYAVEKDSERPVPLQKFLSLGKGKNADPERLRLLIWDAVLWDNKKVTDSYEEVLDELEFELGDCKYVKSPTWFKPTTHEDLKSLWKHYVEDQGHEGFIIRRRSDWFKLKPILDVDAVIIGLNKRKHWNKQRVQSIKTGLMMEDGTVVELTDVSSGIGHELQKELWKLTGYRLLDDFDTMYIKPRVIVTVEYTETIPAMKESYVYKDGKKYNGGMVNFVSLRHPRFIGFRPDKSFNKYDIRASQIPDF